MLRAFKQAGRQPQEVDFVELHATGKSLNGAAPPPLFIFATPGTASGDPTEANWVGESFLKSDNRELLIGSLKGNLGYVVGTTSVNLLSYPLHVVIWRLQHFLRRCVKFVPFFNQELFPRTSISST